ncbi:GGDEF domain-containing protein [Oxalobacteraceae bacterium]|nr:GGDEF domain-containing protein [Oxalobacteraceae bacterium]
MSLRIKLMLALLLSGLATVAMVGGLAYVGLTDKVDMLRRQQAADHFYHFMSGYLNEYGDWRRASAAEPFDRYVQRIRRMESDAMNASADSPVLGGQLGQANSFLRGSMPAPPPNAYPGLDSDGGPEPRGERPPGPDGRPPRPLEWSPMRPPEQAQEQELHGEPSRQPPQQQRAQRPGRPAPPQSGEPPFHFIVADQDFRVLLGAGVYRPGESLPEAARKGARAVKVGGRIAAYISAEGVLTPGKEEMQYIEAMREALLAGVSGAAVLALVLGLLLSQGLSLKLFQLTRAVRAMQGGSLLQRVPVKGKDEVAALATAFNAMSEQLARSHEELQASHVTILAQAEQLRELSVRDALTDLYNRRHFDEQASTLFNQAVRHKRPLSLVIGDIDFFKRINDQFSHATGDAVLRRVSAILRNHMRLTDLVARYGGEEFVIALPETALPQAAALCDKLRNLIEGHPWHEVHPDLKVTISMGVSADLAAGTAEAMLRHADTLLYRAKEAGRNRVCFA